MSRLTGLSAAVFGRHLLLRLALIVVTLLGVAVTIATSLGVQKTIFWAVLGSVVTFAGPWLKDLWQADKTKEDPSLSPADMAIMMKDHHDDLLDSVARIIGPALTPPLGRRIPLDLECRVANGADGTGLSGNGSVSHVTAIDDAYKAEGKQIVILGAPGAGKTMLLYQLADKLLEAAKADPDAPIPVVLDLNNWSNGRLAFDDWLLRELKRPNYGIGDSFGRTLIKKERIIPLLDGLDEVGDENIGACVAAINRFRDDDHGQLPMVVCSRLEEYRAIDDKLNLRGEVVVQPISKADILDCLKHPEMAGVASLLAEDQGLIELLSTPLFLSIVVLTYRGKATPTGTPAEWRSRLLADFVAAQLTPPSGAQAPYAADRTRSWLSWLAQKMRAHQVEDTFYFDLVQPDWLRSPVQGRLVTAGLAVSVGIVVAVLAWLGNAPVFGSWATGLAVVGALTAGLAAYEPGIAPTSKLRLSWQRWGGHAMGWLLFGPLFGLLAGLSVGLIVRLRGGLIGALAIVVSGLIAGLCLGIFFALVSILDTAPYSIPSGPGKAIESSKRNALVGGLVLALSAGLIAGVGGGLIVELGVLPPDLRADVTAWLVPGLIVQGVAFAVVVGAFGWDPGIRIGAVGSRLRTGLIIGFGVALVDAQVGLLMSGQSGHIGHALSTHLGGANAKGLAAGILLGVLVGVGTGIVHGILRGGGAYLRHELLVALLVREGSMAPRYLDFLAFASRVNLLQRRGGGYRFPSRFLLDYFAGPSGPAPMQPVQPVQPVQPPVPVS